MYIEPHVQRHVDAWFVFFVFGEQSVEISVFQPLDYEIFHWWEHAVSRTAVLFASLMCAIRSYESPVGEHVQHSMFASGVALCGHQH